MATRTGTVDISEETRRADFPPAPERPTLLVSHLGPVNDPGSWSNLGKC